jgi:hypothetical protein
LKPSFVTSLVSSIIPSLQQSINITLNKLNISFPTIILLVSIKNDDDSRSIKHYLYIIIIIPIIVFLYFCALLFLNQKN